MSVVALGNSLRSGEKALNKNYSRTSAAIKKNISSLTTSTETQTSTGILSTMHQIKIDLHFAFTVDFMKSVKCKIYGCRAYHVPGGWGIPLEGLINGDAQSVRVCFLGFLSQGVNFITFSFLKLGIFFGKSYGKQGMLFG